MTSLKRIAIFHTEFIFSGGAEKLIFNQVKYFQKLGYKVDVFACVVNKKTSYPDVINKYNVNQILPEFFNSFFGNKIMIVLTLLSFPLWAMKVKAYNIYIGENQVGPWLAFLASFFNKKPYFTYQPYPTTFTRPRGVDNPNLLLYPLTFLDKYVIKNAKVCFSNGLYAKGVLESTYGRKFINCAAGAEEQAFTKEIFEGRFNNPYVLSTNRNMPKKRLDWAEKVVPKNIKLIKIGQGTKTGYVNENSLGSYYKNALVYIYVSPEEDFGMGIVEAMSFGVPVVAWNYAGPSKIIKNGSTGYLAKPYDLKNFKDLVVKLIENPRLNYKMAEHGFNESKKHNWKKHVRTIEKYF